MTLNQIQDRVKQVVRIAALSAEHRVRSAIQQALTPIQHPLFINCQRPRIETLIGNGQQFFSTLSLFGSVIFTIGTLGRLPPQVHQRRVSHCGFQIEAEPATISRSFRKPALHCVQQEALHDIKSIMWIRDQSVQIPLDRNRVAHDKLRRIGQRRPTCRDLVKQRTRRV